MSARQSEWFNMRRTQMEQDRARLYIAISVSLLINAAAFYLMLEYLPLRWWHETPIAQIIKLVTPEEAAPPSKPASPPKPLQTPRTQPSARTPEDMGFDLPKAHAPSPESAPSPEARSPESTSGVTAIAPRTGARISPFDRQTIDKVAKAETEQEIERRSSDITFDTKELAYAGYMGLLKQKIESVWQYPREARRLGIDGDLVMRFTVLRDGRLGGIEVLRTSGRADLDEAAKRALYEGQPYWPLPETWDKNELSIVGHFIYSLGTQQVR